MKRFAFVLVLICFSVQSFAAEKAVWIGPGTMTCAQVAQAYRDHPEDENLFFSWAEGFMSGLNTELLQRGETDLNGLPLDTQKQFIKSYCKDHPRTPYLGAVFKLFDRMRRDQGLPSYIQNLHEPQKK